MRLDRVAPGDVIKAAIKGEDRYLGEVTEIKRGVVYFVPLCPGGRLARRQRTRDRRRLA